jgi:hypothetical protein
MYTWLLSLPVTFFGRPDLVTEDPPFWAETSIYRFQRFRNVQKENKLCKFGEPLWQAVKWRNEKINEKKIPGSHPNPGNL